MRKNLRSLTVIGTVVVLLFGLGAQVSYAQAEESEADIRYLILLREWGIPGDLASSVQNAGGKLTATVDQIGVAVATSDKADFPRLVTRHPGVWGVAADEEIQSAAEDMKFYVNEEPLGVQKGKGAKGQGPKKGAESHDPGQAAFFPLQWNMRAIEADKAWEAGFKGDPSVTVAVLDTGIDYTHLDLFGTVDISRSTSFVTNIPDDPETSIREDISCSDPFLIDKLFPGEFPWIDLNFHGTWVSGIVAAQGFGVSGVAPHVQLMAVKVLNACGFGFFSWIIQGIVFAANADADVINLSLGARLPRSCMFADLEPGERGELRNGCAALVTALNRATTFAHRQGSLVVSSAGNGATNADMDRDTIIVPAQNPNVVGVSATGPIAAIGVEPDTVASYTDFGHSLADVAAPGGDFRRFPVGDWFLDMVLGPCSSFSLLIPICQTGTFFVFAAGTSASSPHAAAVAALIDSNEQGGLGGSQLETGLEGTADDLGKSGADPFYGHGRVNAFRAATEARP